MLAKMEDRLGSRIDRVEARLDQRIDRFDQRIDAVLLAETGAPPARRWANSQRGENH